MAGTDERDDRARSGRAARTERRRAARSRAERELAELRFVEVPETADSAFWRTAVGLSIALAVGTGASWAALLIAAIVGDEALWQLSHELDVEAFLRATVLPLFGLAAALAITIPLLGALDVAAALRLLERHASAEPGQVPSSVHRARLAILPARHVRRAALVVAVIAMAVGGFCLLFALIDDEGRTPIVWTIIGVSLVAVLGWLVVRSSLVSVEERQEYRRAVLEAGWADTVTVADLSEQRRREASTAIEPPPQLLPTFTRRIDRAIVVAACALGAAVAIWFVSVWLRQPCRRCDERYFDDPIERLIDGLSLWGGVAIACAMVVTAALVVVRLVLMRRVEVGAMRWVADGRPRRVPGEVAESMLLGPRAGLWTSRLIVAVFAPFAAFVVLAALVDPELPLGGVAVAIALAVAVAAPVVAALVGLADLRSAARERNVLRAVLSPGDPDAASIAVRDAAEQRARAKRARRAQRRGRG
ncbi:hypothetical protein [Agromyces italicus]|uniref:hypothetical protein n=1 Tax=Agromyces italicus TaxID=279572 RepID=UPI0003B71C8D|nr:hypothetical protein [Agromyces italicus]